MRLFSFLKKEFVKNVLTLVTGSAISHAILYFSILIITRIFSTELFGLYILFSSATLILKQLFTLQYEFTIILSKKEDEAINLFSFSLIILLLFNILFFLIILFFKDDLALFFHIEDLKNYLYLLPISVFFSGFISILDCWNNRANKFANISKGQIVKSASMSSIQLITGFSKYNSYGLIPGMIIGLFIHLLYLLKKTFTSLKLLKENISFKKMIALAKRYKDIPIFNTCINVTNNISNEIPVFLISNYFGLSVAGIFGLAIKFTKAPISIIQNSVNQVFFNKASKIYNDQGDLKSLILKTSKNLLILGFLIFIPLFIISFYLDVLFGKEWENVGWYSRILIPWLFFALLSNPLSSLILILNKQKTILFFDIITLILRFFSFYIGYHFYDSIFISLVLFSSVGVIFNIFLFLFLLSVGSKKNIAY